MLTPEQLAEQKDAAYAERNKCVAAIVIVAVKKGWATGLALHSRDDALWDEEWRNIVWIELPTGQVTWHIHDRELPMFTALQLKQCDWFKWDGHSTQEKYDRLLGLWGHAWL